MFASFELEFDTGKLDQILNDPDYGIIKYTVNIEVVFDEDANQTTYSTVTVEYVVEKGINQALSETGHRKIEVFYKDSDANEVLKGDNIEVVKTEVLTNKSLTAYLIDYIELY